MLRAEHVERDHGGRELGRRSGDQRQVRSEGGELLAGLEIDDQMADLGARGAGRDRCLQRLEIGQDQGRRRHRCGGLAVLLDPIEEIGDRCLDDRRGRGRDGIDVGADRGRDGADLGGDCADLGRAGSDRGRAGIEFGRADDDRRGRRRDFRRRAVAGAGAKEQERGKRRAASARKQSHRGSPGVGSIWD